MDKGLKGLFATASAAGLQTEYTSSSGEKRKAAPEAIEALLAQLGDENCDRWMEPVAVLWNGQGSIKATRPLPPRARLYLEDEQGHLSALEFRNSTKGVTEIALTNLPFGYYNGILEIGKVIEEFLVISAPKKCYSAFEKERAWGLFIPTYAIRDKNSWAAGNLTSLGNFSEWLADNGGTAACTLPLLDCFLDKPICEPSPYAPATRLFWNEFYLDIEALPELQQNKPAARLIKSKSFQTKLETLQRASFVYYKEEYQLRNSVLKLLAKDFGTKPSAKLKDYARFRATCDYYNKPWGDWPGRASYREEDFQYYIYVQTAAARQMELLTKRLQSKGAQLFLDLPVGVHPASYDVWKHRDLFLSRVSVGAPPDAFFTNGQNWGFPPMNPRALRNSGYKYVREYLGMLMSATGLLRIDHVMGLHRLYCVPKGMDATQGVYVRYNAEEQFAILALESWKHKCTIVGENLGTVPETINKAMERHGVHGMYVLQFSFSGNSRKPLNAPAAKSVAYINTHDMPTFAGFATGKEIEFRKDIDLASPKQASALKAERKKTVAALKRYLSGKDLFEQILGWLSRSQASLVIASLEDLWGELGAQNVPGTTTEHPNWRRRMKFSLEELKKSPKVKRLLAALQVPRVK